MRLVTVLTRRWVKVGMAVMAISAMALPALALSAPAGASPTPTPTVTCPAVEEDTGCGYIITVGPTDVGTIASPAPGQPPYDGSEDVIVGIVNDSDALVSSVTLSGSGDPAGADDIFGFDGDGMCTKQFSGDTYCATLSGDPSGYEGPENTFSNESPDKVQGNVNFTTPLPPGGNTYFSLEEAPTSVVSVGFQPDISVSASPVSGTEGLSTGAVPVATFTDGPNTSPVTDFTATTNWGDGSRPSTSSITQSTVGSPYVVTDSHTYAEEGSYTTTVRVSDNSLASTNFGSASSTATIADAPLSPTPTQPAIPNATTDKSFTAVVASFLDGNPSASITDYTTSPGGAVINWGDSSTSAGTVTLVSQPGGTSPTEFEVSGTHTYGANGTYTITVDVTDVGGSTTTTVTNQVSDYDAVITCSSSPCSGTATSSTQTTGASTTSTTGTILLDLNNVPVSGAFSCNDPFRHAPQYSTILENGLSASGSVDLSITFANSAAGGFWLDPFAVCFKSPGVPFTDLFGHSVTLGLLPICPFARPGHPVVGPCVQSIYYSTIFPLPSEKGTVTENLILPPNDPLSH
jgi:hypothetical protein